MITDKPKEMNPELGEMALEYKDKEDSMYKEIAPTALKMFSKASLNNLVDAYNVVSKLFGLPGDYPSFDADQKTLPVDFVKGLSMVKTSIDDAITMDVLDEDMSFSLADVNTSNGLLSIASKIIMASKDKMFKRFLLEEAPEPNAPTELRLQEEAPKPPVTKPEGSTDLATLLGRL